MATLVFFSNLFLNGVVTLIGQLVTGLGRNDKMKAQQDSLRLHGQPHET